MSDWLVTARPPAATIYATTVFAASRLMSLTRTAAPSAAKVLAWAAPKPPPAPVTMTTRPEHIPDITFIPTVFLGW